MMKTPISWGSRYLLVGFVAGAALLPTGCRSTRSNMSQLPGMAWVGPKDAETFGDWNEADDRNLQVPSKSATPQLATNSGPSAVGKAGEYPSPGKPSSADTDTALSSIDMEYPDTGYPPLEQPTPPAAPRHYAASEHDGGPGSSTHSRAAQTGSIQQPPDRGFYGDQNGSKYDDLAGPAESLGLPSRSNAERFDESPTRSDSTYRDTPYIDTPYNDTKSSAGTSRYGANDDLPPHGQDVDTPNYHGVADDRRLTVSDSESSYDPNGEQSYDPSLENGPADSTYPTDLIDGQSADDAGLAGTARTLGDGLRNDYRRASDEFKGRIEEGTSSLSESSRGFTQDVKEFAEQAGDQMERSAAGLGRGIRDGFSRFSGTDESSAGALSGSMGQRAHESAPNASAPSGSQSPTEFGSNGLAAPKRTRVGQQWRPGSTGSYPIETLDQSGYQIMDDQGGVEPVSYPPRTSRHPLLSPTRR